MMGKYLVEINE
jgi:hypothetical protein